MTIVRYASGLQSTAALSLKNHAGRGSSPVDVAYSRVSSALNTAHSESGI